MCGATIQECPMTQTLKRKGFTFELETNSHGWVKIFEIENGKRSKCRFNAHDMGSALQYVYQSYPVGSEYITMDELVEK